jgi:hypothetical protein
MSAEQVIRPGVQQQAMWERASSELRCPSLLVVLQMKKNQSRILKSNNSIQFVQAMAIKCFDAEAALGGSGILRHSKYKAAQLPAVNMP